MRSALRTPLTYLVGFLATGLAATAVILMSGFAPASPLIERVIRRWARTILWAGDVDLRVIGTEHVDPATSYVVVSNHQSTFDIMAHFLALPVPIRFLAKKELFGVPLLGWALRRLQMVPVDRFTRKNVFREVEQSAAATAALGHSLIVYPEGTRTTTGDLLPFKNGAFFIAVHNRLPILPTTIEGSFEAWLPRAKLIGGGPVTVAIGKPIPTARLTVDDVPGLRDQTRKEIEATLSVLRSQRAG